MSAISAQGNTERPMAPMLGLACALAAATLLAAFCILREDWTAAAGLFMGCALYLAILVDWKRGIYGLLLYLPISGVVTLVFYGWTGPEIFQPVLFKDWLFVLPTYVGFLCAIALRRQRFPLISRPLAAFLGAFAALVIAQMLNPGVSSPLGALIGAKVWLSYMPLYVLILALVNDRAELTRLFRMLAVMAVLPCALGVGEYIASLFWGYERVMSAIYGGAAADVTQSLSWFAVGGGQILRIPSTFTFELQYFGFTLAMLVPCFALARGDASPSWRRFGKWMLVFVAMAGFLSGARAAYIFIPLLLVLMYWLNRGFTGALRAVGYTAAGLAAALAISRVAARPLFELMSGLFADYAVGTAYGGLVESFTSSWLGHGTGTNTGSARYALERPEFFRAIENYYAKAAYELGALGLLLLIAIFVALLVLGSRILKRLRDPALHATGAALLAFLIVAMLYSFKTWLLDLDPVNVYFWLFAGMLACLPALDRPPEDATEPIAIGEEVQ
ncbi:MAG: hypothetical protein WBF35_05360 [Candidatus Acidiferrales bacterium]